MVKDPFAILREKALANFDLLLDLWNITYKKISDSEYDYLNPNRNDTRFGACRFNVVKGIGTDFAAPELREQDFKLLGPGFTAEDFSGLSSDFKETKQGYDVIGLCQRIHKVPTYQEAASLLRKHAVLLTASDEYRDHKKISAERQKLLDNQRLHTLKKNDFTWAACTSVKDTIGARYLASRCISIGETEPNVKFHPKVYNRETKGTLPALIFKVSSSPEGGLNALHRVYLSEDGRTKAKIENPKMAIGPIKGNGIWLGTPGPKLYIVEGPENALTFRDIGCEFVVSTVYASNFGNLVIPEYVEHIVAAIDNDSAGRAFAVKAAKNYTLSQNKVMSIVSPPGEEDWNDLHVKSVRSVA